ncbi:MAG: NifB/NifX family molybdenum-iron cluster-binding protein [Patescibacteria group bacterium]|nr:NifB/NifX family molybdenum-iron cluster-binding protein [Patescibacteria group bacterium]
MPRSEETQSKRVGAPSAKVAVPEWQGRVSPVFDVAARVLLVDLRGETKPGQPHVEGLGGTSPRERVQRLVQWRVDVLVCGAISWPLEALLAAEGVRVIANICGPVQEVIQAFHDGTLEDGQFAMPGCCRKRRHGQRRRCHGGGGP